LIPHGARFTLDRKAEPGDATRVQLPHPELFGLLDKGQRLLINDGKIRLRVVEAGAQEIVCTADVGGVISDRKGVNVPDAEIPIPALTDKDRRDLAFAMEHGADWIGLDRKSTRLNSSHVKISYAVFCLKKKKEKIHHPTN